MELTEEDVEFIRDCLQYYLQNEDFVSYDEYVAQANKILKLLVKLSDKIPFQKAR